MSDPAGSLRGKAALVLGLGVHGGGAGVVRFLVEHGAVVTVTDLRPPEKLETTLARSRFCPCATCSASIGRPTFAAPT
ncbi:MAG: hypothetical protein WKH64_03235 [Chloroflexia bacterium]